MNGELDNLLRGLLETLPVSLLLLALTAAGLVKVITDAIKRRFALQGNAVQWLSLGVAFVATALVTLLAQFRPDTAQDWAGLAAVWWFLASGSTAINEYIKNRDNPDAKLLREADRILGQVRERLP